VSSSQLWTAYVVSESEMHKTETNERTFSYTTIFIIENLNFSVMKK